MAHFLEHTRSEMLTLTGLWLCICGSAYMITHTHNLSDVVKSREKWHSTFWHFIKQKHCMSNTGVHLICFISRSNKTPNLVRILHAPLKTLVLWHKYILWFCCLSLKQHYIHALYSLSAVSNAWLHYTYLSLLSTRPDVGSHRVGIGKHWFIL